MLISIVGKSASGKSSIAKKLESYDDRILHIDVDQISHAVLTIPEVQKKLVTCFGNQIMENKTINRKALGEIVFSSTQKMDELTSITWPSMEKIIDRKISENSDKIIILDWILLPKTKYFKASTLKIWVDLSQEERIKRALHRAGPSEKLTREYFMKRDNSGIEYQEGKYDIFINNQDIVETERKAREIYETCIISREL